jgi:hypothetical protein
VTHDEYRDIETAVLRKQGLSYAQAKLLLEQLADAERKLQPGNAEPDMHACERAIRDLETLERLRDPARGEWLLEKLRRDLRPRYAAFSCFEEHVRALDELIALLSPGDAGRGEAGGDDAR